MFAAAKMMILVKRGNPTITSVLRKNAFLTEDRLNLQDTKVRLAFGVEGFINLD